MGFLAPYMLWGALAAGIPIALHFLFRSRYRRVPWAAMKYLLLSLEQTSRRLKFQELLLLLARITLLLLVALALARPSSSMGRGTGGGDPVDAVLLIDTSYSMDAREGTTTRLDRAQAAAKSVLDQLPPQSSVQVITCTDRPSLLGPHQPADLEKARELVGSLSVDHLATDLLPGVTEAAGVLQRGQLAAKELFVFSDMQKLGWENQGPALAAKMKEIHGQAQVYLVRCGTQTPHNVGVVNIFSQSGIPHTGERAGFVVLVRNSGSTAMRNLTVSLTVDEDPGKRESQPLPEIGAGETRAVTLTAVLDRPGLRLLTATVKPDEMEADNRFDQVIHVRDQVRLLVVDGAARDRDPEKAGTFYLEHALLPIKETECGRYHVQLRKLTPRQAVSSSLSDKDLCILVNVALQPTDRGGENLSREFLDELASFVNKGHGLLLFAGDHTSAESYNRILLRQHGLLPAAVAEEKAEVLPVPARLDRSSISDRSFTMFREDKYYTALNGIEVRHRLVVDEPKTKETTENDPAHVIMRYIDGKPAVVTRRVGAGEVMLVTTSADLSWSDLPLRNGIYVPFVDAALNHLLQDQGQTHNLTAGVPLRWYPTEWDSVHPFVLIDPSGRPTRLGTPELEKGRPVVTAGDTMQAGIYRLAFEDSSAEPGASDGRSLAGVDAPASDKGDSFRREAGSP